MISLNSISIIGRAVNDPESRNTKGGTNVASFRLAVDQSMSKDDETEAMFLDVTCFGKQAETAVKHFRKGSLLGVTGRLAQRSYVSNKTNTKVVVTEIVADRICFVGPKPNDAPEAKQAEATTMEQATYTEPVQQAESNVSDLDIDDDSLPFI